ncbi:hypothetical protein SKAU_G00005430 [Synaphobranchus kaupii]|uniref:Astrotactin-1/2 N-terminal domain-containing protein n=1 Tax=Synaphobranchus kaupii TaxID=118154 RepID=A0A9Q1GA10_SYNKA|nr:hypothetical protein SKAU_G00005430 [Synaphobranchus kaupii]
MTLRARGRLSIERSLPLHFPEMSGTGAEISLVHWKQQWLENGTLYFHLSLSSAEQLFQVTPPPAQEPAHVLHEHVHLLHISVMWIRCREHSPEESLKHSTSKHY